MPAAASQIAARHEVTAIISRPVMQFDRRRVIQHASSNKWLAPGNNSTIFILRKRLDQPHHCLLRILSRAGSPNELFSGRLSIGATRSKSTATAALQRFGRTRNLFPAPHNCVRNCRPIGSFAQIAPWEPVCIAKRKRLVSFAVRMTNEQESGFDVSRRGRGNRPEPEKGHRSA